MIGHRHASVETSQHEIHSPQAAHAPKPQPTQAAIEAVLGNPSLRAALFKLLPPDMHDADAVRAAMQTPSDLARLQLMSLLSQQSGMSTNLRRTLRGTDSR